MCIMKQLASQVSRVRVLLALSSLCWSCCRFTRAQQGFVSIDCGANATYIDSNGLYWTSDDTIVYAGNKSFVTPPTNTDAPVQFSTIRYFPGNQSKYCYVLNNKDHGVEQNSTYLVRASFWAGQGLPYETRVPNTVSFKLLLYADEWDDVFITLPQTSVAMFKEIYVVAIKNSIDVCVAGKDTGMDIPFISSLVLRPLSPTTDYWGAMNDNGGSKLLSYMYRINYGAPSADTIISYLGDLSGDSFDRVWQPDTRNPISTMSAIDTNVSDFPPLKVMQTAYQNEIALELNFSVPSKQCYKYSVYFAELSPNVTRPGERVFKLQVLTGPGPPYDETPIDIFNSTSSLYSTYTFYSVVPACVEDGGIIEFALMKESGSTYGPIVCGLELLQFSDHDIPLGTDSDEVAALTSIMTSFYPSLNTWSGDPCLPLPYAYSWVTCDSRPRPFISSIDLSNKGLTGEIPNDFNRFQFLAKLSLANNALSGPIPNLSLCQSLEALDLQGNTLSGTVPDFLGDLPSLETLNLAYNNFSGQIPSSLLAKVSSKKLKLSVEGNPFLCEGNNNEEYCKDLFGSNNSATNGEPLKKKKGNVALIAGIATTGVIAALVAMGLLTTCIVKQNKKTSDAIRHPSNKQANTHQRIDPEESVLAHAKRLQRSNQAHEFTFQAIKTMTRNFETMLGQGGFGLVYYGVLENETKVAVKILANNSRQGEHEFLNEVEFLSRVHHKTLVNLVGYCTEGQLVLVYEFMANGTLREALDGRRTQFVSWKDRLQVAINAAEGLDYLHRGCNPSVIHRDVKSSNILLNEQFEGKISDFGISKAKQFIDTMDEGSQTFTTVQGSFGYLDPAYAETNIANHSIDVYAFGIVLFEVITGKPSLTKQLRSGEEPQHILQWARPQIERGDISQLVDPRLYQDFDVSSMWKVIDVAMMCVERDRKRRPTMNEIVVELKTALSMEHQIFINDTNILDQQAAFTYITDVHVR